MLQLFTDDVNGLNIVMLVRLNIQPEIYVRLKHRVKRRE